MESFACVGNETVGVAIARNLQEAGYELANDVAQADVVFTYCTSQTALEDVYLDEGGLIQAAHPGTILIDLSSTTPGFSRELNAVAVVNDLVPVEAPLIVINVACDDAFANRENLACFLAADEEGIQAGRELLEAALGSVQDTGGPGSAQLARAAYTLQTTAQIISAIEADALYRAFNLATGNDQMGRAGATTPAASQVLDAVLNSHFEGTYTVEMFMSELSAALTAADDVDLILPQAEACMHLLELLAIIGGSDKAPAALSLAYAEESACAEHGLDWSRAEEAYGGENTEYFDELDDIDECAGGHDHDHHNDFGSYPDYPGDYPGPYGAYSAN